MYNLLTKCSLFQGIEAHLIESLIGEVDFELKQYGVNEVVALKGTPCKWLMIMTEGKACCEITDRKNLSSPVEVLVAPAIITPVLLYAPENKLPVDVVVTEPSTVLFICRSDFSKMLQKELQVLENFLTIVSHSNKPLSDKTLYLGIKTIKGKFAHYLLDLYEQKHTDQFRLDRTQQQLAEIFGVTRPALARAVREMVNEGSIYVDRKDVTILFPEKLKHYLKE